MNPILAILFLAVAGVVGVTLAAAYALPAFSEVFWAEPGQDSVSAKVHDLDARERALLWALLIPIVWIGLHPAPLLALIETGVRTLQL